MKAPKIKKRKRYADGKLNVDPNKQQVDANGIAMPNLGADTSTMSFNPLTLNKLTEDQKYQFSNLKTDAEKQDYLKSIGVEEEKDSSGAASTAMGIAGSISSMAGAEFTKNAQKGADKYGYIDPNQANAGRFLDYTGKGMATGTSIGGPVGGLVGAIAGTFLAGVSGASANEKNRKESNRLRMQENASMSYANIADKKGGGIQQREKSEADKMAYMGNALMSGGVSHFLSEGKQPSKGLLESLGGKTGVISGKGGPKSDDIPMNVQPEDMIVPAEKAKEAIALLLKHTDYKQVKAVKGKKSGANAQVSDGEVIISPKHVQQLQAAGIDLHALAPNANNANQSFYGGKMPTQKDADSLKAGKARLLQEEKAKKELAEKRKFVSDEDLKDPNMQAYLFALAKAESNFVNTARNPDSTAEGTFQFIDDTHKNIKNMYGYDGRSHDWDEAGRASVALIKEKPKAMKAIKEGRFQDADAILNPVWSSLPGGVHPSTHTEKYQLYRENYLAGQHQELDKFKKDYESSVAPTTSTMPQPNNPLMSPGKPLRGIVSDFADGKLPGYFGGKQSELISKGGTKKPMSEDEMIKKIIVSAYSHGITDKNQIDALIAIAKHESKLQPVREKWNGTPKPGDKDNPGDYKNGNYYGRGLVQMTGATDGTKGPGNYAKATEYFKKRGLNYDLVNNPDLALDPDVAIELLVVGTKDGWWTGKKLADVANKNPEDIYRIVNPKAQDDKIAQFTDSLTSAKDTTSTYFTSSIDPKTNKNQYIIKPEALGESETNAPKKENSDFEEAKRKYGIAEKKYQEAEKKRKAAGNNVPVSDPLNKDLVAARKERDQALKAVSKKYDDALAERNKAGNNVTAADPLNKKLVEAKKELDAIKKEAETNNPYTNDDVESLDKEKKDLGPNEKDYADRRATLEKTAPKTFDPQIPSTPVDPTLYLDDDAKKYLADQKEKKRQVELEKFRNDPLTPDPNSLFDNGAPVEGLEKQKIDYENNDYIDDNGNYVSGMPQSVKNRIAEDPTAIRDVNGNVIPPTPTPPPGPKGETNAMKIFNSLGGAGGLFALAQTGFGLYGLAHNKAPEPYETDPVVKKMRDDALLDSERIDPAIKAATERNFELTRRGQIEQIQQMAGTDTGLAVNSMRRAGIDKNRAIVDLAAMQEGQKLQKKQFAAGLAGQVSQMDRRGWEDKQNMFIMNQQAAGQTMNAGLTNLLGAMNFREQNKKLDAIDANNNAWQSNLSKQLQDWQKTTPPTTNPE